MNRLLTIASLVDKNAVLYDIGTDHGYLFIHVFDKIKQGFALDIAEKPLQTAINTINYNNLYTKVSAVLSDGLDKVDFNQATQISICGMGAELIIDILLASPHFQSQNIDYIFQPMTKTPLLREFLLNNGFTITDEVISIEERRVYTIIKCKYTGIIHSVDIFDCLISQPLTRDPLFADYIDFYISRYNEIYSKISDTQNERYLLYSKLEKILKGYKNDYC